MGFFPQFFRQTPVGKWTSGLFQAKVPLRLQGKHLQEERHPHPVQYRTKQYFQTNTENSRKSKSSRFFKIFIFSFRFCCPPFVSPTNFHVSIFAPILRYFSVKSTYLDHVGHPKIPNFFSHELDWNPQRFSLGENNAVLPIIFWIKSPWNPQTFLGISSTFFPQITRKISRWNPVKSTKWRPCGFSWFRTRSAPQDSRSPNQARPGWGFLNGWAMGKAWEKHGKMVISPGKIVI